MKRNDLLNNCDLKDVNFSEKVAAIRGGGIRLKTNAHLYLGIRKSMIISQEKYAKTLA